MKRKLCIFFTLLYVLFIAACGSFRITNAKDEFAGAKKGVTASVESMEKAVNDKDKYGFLRLIDESNAEFYTEESHWFDDLAENPTEDFSMNVIKIKGISNDTFKVTIKQSYYCKKTINMNYDCIFKKYDDNYKFYDLYFEELSTSNFKIKYAPSLRDKAVLLSQFVDDAYGTVKNVYGYAPEEKTVIKLYDDINLLKYFVKPSMSLNLGGWFEGGESIKINMTPMSLNSIGMDKFREVYTGMISHELTHKINFIESRNNAPYWLLEGIATFVQRNGRMIDQMPSMNIKVLEKRDLEKLGTQEEVMNYYNNAYIYVSHFIDRYGKDKLHQIMLELGKYPEKDKTAELLIYENNITFHEVLQKTMSISIDDLNTLSQQ